MSFFSFKGDAAASFLVVDIGSGSVGLAITVSKAGEEKPEMLWTHREYSLIKDIETTAWSLREINTAIINAFLKLGSDGLKRLRETDGAPPLSSMVVTVAAPWAYTVSKTIHYTEPRHFAVTESLIEELADTAHKKAMEDILKESLLKESGLTTLESETIGVIANDYVLETYEDVKTNDLTIVELLGVCHERILSTLEEAQNKVIPRTARFTHSFMMSFYATLRRAYPDTYECCLIDLTSEATEIGIVRDNLLRHATHMPYGSYTLAREIAEMAKIPKEEAYAYLRGGGAMILNKLTDARRAELSVIVDAFEEKLAKLFRQTGDTLAIPKTLYLHTDADVEAFFTESLTRAAHRATGMQHVVHPITKELFNGKPGSTSDTAILLSALRIHHERLEHL